MLGLFTVSYREPKLRDQAITKYQMCIRDTQPHLAHETGPRSAWHYICLSGQITLQPGVCLLCVQFPEEKKRNGLNVADLQLIFRSLNYVPFCRSVTLAHSISAEASCLNYNLIRFVLTMVRMLYKILKRQITPFIQSRDMFVQFSRKKKKLIKLEMC